MFILNDRISSWLRERLAGHQDIKKKFKQVDSEYKSVLQKPSCRAEKLFLFDIDEVNREGAIAARKKLESVTEVKQFAETPNGYHIITTPFNYTELSLAVEYELKKDAMLFVSFLGEGQLFDIDVNTNDSGDAVPKFCPFCPSKSVEKTGDGFTCSVCENSFSRQ